MPSYAATAEAAYAARLMPRRYFITLISYATYVFCCRRLLMPVMLSAPIFSLLLSFHTLTILQELMPLMLPLRFLFSCHEGADACHYFTSLLLIRLLRLRDVS